MAGSDRNHPLRAVERGGGWLRYTNSIKKKWQFVIQKTIMKKYLLVLLVPFSAWAIELHPVQECESLKTILSSNLTQYNTTAANLVYEATRIKTSANSLQNRNDFAVGGSDYALIQTINANADEVIRNASVISNQTSYLLGVVSNVVCSACPVDDGGDSSCCEDAVALLQTISEDTASISSLLGDAVFVLGQMDDALSEIWALLYQGLNDITNQLAYADFLLDHGFLSITNQLRFLLGSNLTYPTTVVGNTEMGTYYLKKSNNTFASKSWAVSPSGLIPNSLYGWLRIFQWFFGNVGTHLVSYENYAYDFERKNFPILTNTVGAIHRDTTNYFSFFRGEIGVQGVLADWQSENVSGSYHDFLTNHYLTVVRGGSLSGNQSSKTNWFSRIETLLAALVFTDSSETNTVDASAGRQERAQLQTSYENVNQSAATFSQNFGQTSQSMVSLYRSYFQTFENASMPSHVVLMRLSSDSSEDIEISFQSDAISVLVEACRVVSTFCWASVGILLLYKFLVWAGRCIVVTCQFIYRVISSVFK